MNIMIDIETLGTSNNSAIVSIGAVRFSKTQVYEDNCMYGVLDTEEAIINYGRTQDRRCLEEFWKPLGGVPKGDVPLLTALESLNSYLSGNDTIWCAGPHFDIAILQDCYYAVGLIPNWKFWRIRDYRTIRDTVGKDIPRESSVSHNALDDAIEQAKHLVQINKELDVCIIR